MKPILVIGDAMLDVIHEGVIERMSPEEPSAPVIRITGTSYHAGGAANVALNLWALGAPRMLFLVPGKGQSWKRLHQMLPPPRPATVFDGDRETTVKTRYLIGGKQLFRADEEETEPLDGLILDRILAALEENVPNVSAVIISDYAKGVVTDAVAKHAIAEARMHKVPVLVDAKRPDRECFHGATVIKPNLRELMAACPDPDPNPLKRLLRLSKAQNIVLTLGQQGMNLAMRLNGGGAIGEMGIDAHDVPVADAIGAGDTVIAALAFALAKGTPMVTAAFFANAAAAISVQHRGPYAPSLDEIGKLYDHPFSRDTSIARPHVAGRQAEDRPD